MNSAMNLSIPQNTLDLLFDGTLKVGVSSCLNSAEIHKLHVLLSVVPQNTYSLTVGNTVMD